MLPGSWGAPHPGPRGYDLVADGRRVEARYRTLAGAAESRQLEAVFDVALRAGADRVFIDRPYIDSDYRSDLAHFYGRAFRPPPDTTERLLFADKKSVVGAAVIRPLPQQVGRTLMAPPADEAPYVSCLARMPVHAFGQTWQVRGFPFTSQDGEYGVCAHAAMWSIARYHHLCHKADNLTTSAIIEAAGLRERADRTTRSEGVSAIDVVRGFRGIGLPALVNAVSTIRPPETLDSVACRYLNSGIPVGLLTGNHMKVLVGYGERANGSIFYIVCDDNFGAYRREDPVLSEGVDEWKMLVIPQPGRIHVNGEAAEARAEEAFEDRIRAKTGPAGLLPKWQRREFDVRTYATPSSDYVVGLKARGVPPWIIDHHVYAPKGNWIWVSEFHDKKQPEEYRVVGEIVIDATSLQLDPSPILGNICGWSYLWEPGSEDPRIAAPKVAGDAFYRSALPDRSERPPPPAPTAMKSLGKREPID